MRRFDSVLRRLETVAMVGAAVALSGMMLITVIDVVLRYVFNAPLGWSQEVITHYLLPAAFFLALADTLREDGHIRITVIDRYVSARSRWLMSIVGHVLAASLFALLIWHGARVTFDAWQAGNTYPGFILWPTWASLILVPLGMALLELRVLQRLVVLIHAQTSSGFTVVDVVEPSGVPAEEVTGE